MDGPNMKQEGYVTRSFWTAVGMALFLAVRGRALQFRFVSSGT